MFQKNFVSTVRISYLMMIQLRQAYLIDGGSDIIPNPNDDTIETGPFN